MSENRTAYRSLSEEAPALPIFFRDWYLDTVCDPGDWDVALIEKNDALIAALPYYLKQKGPFRYITMPHLCRFMGPYLHPEHRRPDRAQRLLRELIDQLPPYHAFAQHFHYHQTDWLPFYWRGFQQQTRYSYRLEHLQDLDAVFSRLHRDYRNNKIPKAATQVSLRRDLSPAQFYRTAALSFTRQGLQQPFSLPFFERLEKEVRRHDQGQLFFAVDEQERIHSVAWLVWDDQSSYYLVAGDDPDLRASGAGVWLAWQLIRYTSETLRLPVFDFLGSMIEPIARVRRQFGAAAQPYSAVWHTPSTAFWLLEKILARLR